MRRRLLFIFLLFSFVVRGQEAPQVTIIQPVNNAVFDGKQIKVNFEVSGTALNITRIYVDDRQVQLLTNAKRQLLDIYHHTDPQYLQNYNKRLK